VVGVDANPEAYEHARLKYTREPELTFERNMIELWRGDVDCVVFLQTIEHVQDPDAVLEQIKSLVGPDGVAYVSTPNVLTLAPEGAEKSGNPWHVKEYRPEEYRELCERHFGAVELYGLHHARKLRWHQLAIERARWDDVHRGTWDHHGVLRPLHPRDLRTRLQARPAAARRGARLPCRASPVSRPGALALLLHTHMPYVEGYGTWPFGEEWLWEAIATSYVPLLAVLDAPGALDPQCHPCLADQLEAPGALARCEGFLREIRPESHRRDIARATDVGVAAALERSAAQYAAAADAVGGLDVGLWPTRRGRRPPPIQCCRCSATDGGVRLSSLRASPPTGHGAGRRDGPAGSGSRSARTHPWLDPLLGEAGVRLTCVELTDVFGEGAPEQLTPLRSTAGPLLVPIDREVIDLVWGRDGYPAGGAYRDSHRMTEHRHRPWSIDGAPYDATRAGAQARRDAADFVARVQHRVARSGLCVCALDTELLGHWWHEGVMWLEAVLEEAERSGLAVLPLDEAVHRVDAVAAPDLPVTTWGTPRDLSTWGGPGARGLAWRQRRAEIDVAREPRPGPRALRELLALQASDWAFLLSAESAGPYPTERMDGHLAGLAAALRDSSADPSVRNLTPHLVPTAFHGP
jgi:1,4-alpha-glucan branching enzyme